MQRQKYKAYISIIYVKINRCYVKHLRTTTPGVVIQFYRDIIILTRYKLNLINLPVRMWHNCFLQFAIVLVKF